MSTSGDKPTLNPAHAVTAGVSADLNTDEVRQIIGGLLPRLQAEANPAQTESLADEYRIIDTIASGGMGVVYRAQQQHPERIVALKVIRPGLMTPEMLRRFEYEANMLARLEHVGIARIYHAGITDLGAGPQPYFAMELVEGESLTKYVETNRAQLKLRDRAQLFHEICHAVQAAHAKGIVHRDLKPDNILVTAEGKPKVLDFGVARAIDGEKQSSTLHTQTGDIVGTVPYMAPEQIRGEVDQLDQATDVYALGVIGYELFSDQMPYPVKGRPLPEAARIICDEEPGRLSSVHRSLRGDVETIVGKALEKEKTRRYATAGELAADVKRYLDYEPISARPPSTWYNLRKFAKRNGLLVGATGAVLVALSSGTVVATLGVIRAERARLSEAAQRAVAEKRLQNVHAVAQDLVYDLNDAIASLPGSTRARQMLLDTGLRSLDQLAADAGDDVKVLHDLAGAYMKVGELAGWDQTPNLGRTDEAIRCFQKSLDICTKLAVRQPKDPIAQGDISACYARLADMMKQKGDIGAAMELNHRALEINERLVREHPKYSVTYARLGGTHLSLGRLLAMQHRTADAVKQIEQAISWYKRVPDADADQDEQLASCYETLGDLYLGENDLEHAEQTVKQMMALREAQARAKPLDVGVQVCLAAAHDRLAEVLQYRDLAAALVESQRAREILISVMKADSLNAGAKESVAIQEKRVAYLLGRVGRDREAIETFTRALRGFEELRIADPSNANLLRGVATTHAQLALVYRELENEQSAEAHARQASTHIRELADLDQLNAVDAQLAAQMPLIEARPLLRKGFDTSNSKTDRIAALRQAKQVIAAGHAGLKSLAHAGKLQDPLKMLQIIEEMDKGVDQVITTLESMGPLDLFAERAIRFMNIPAPSDAAQGEPTSAPTPATEPHR
jgi:serine/threonine protein kinase